MLLNAQDQAEEDPFMLTEINDSCNKISSAKIEEVVFYIFPYICILYRGVFRTDGYLRGDFAKIIQPLTIFPKTFILDA